jgi:hypothetical protein
MVSSKEKGEAMDKRQEIWKNIWNRVQMLYHVKRVEV